MRALISERAAAFTPAMHLAQPLAGQLLEEAGTQGVAALLNQSGLAAGLMKALAECLLDGELKHHLLSPAAPSGNHRNGSTPKTIATTAGKIELAVPRVRHATFTPRLLPRYQRSIPGFDHGILALYARGIPLSLLQSRLRELYDERAWTELGGTLTYEVLQHVRDWQTRRLEAAYRLVYFGALCSEEDEMAAQASLLAALGLRADGGKEVLGLWAANPLRATPWRAAMLELKERGLAAPSAIAGHRVPGLRKTAARVYPGVRFISTAREEMGQRSGRLVCALRPIHGQ